MRHWALAAVLGTGLATGAPASTGAPETSPKPWPRPEGAGLVAPVQNPVDLAAPPRAAAKLTLAATAVPLAPGATLEFVGLAAARLRGFQAAVAPGPRAMARPGNLSERIEAGLFGLGKKNYPKKGSVCGERAIRGTAIASVPARIPGCGISRPVKVTEIAGVTLSTPATIDCTTAKALLKWVKKGAIPAVGKTGGGLKGLKVAASYSCRTRNNQPGAKISEHGRGRAIDISGFVLKTGAFTVLGDWGKGRYGKILAKMRKSACGTFGTVLGPGSDRFHSDHFHFDTARYRSGAYCR